MGIISYLDSDTINQIAAGEVIENASSVIKELVENALDAQAVSVKIETISSGQGFIAVRDDGIGMSVEDMSLALERHATSKIKKFEDLYALNSLGFRGEALPSIASISKLKLISSDKNHLGYALSIEGGMKVKEEVYSRNRGTCVEVSSLFFNVPVRKKFQKNPRSDFIRIRRLLEDMLLTQSKVGWEWCNDNKTELFIDKETSYEERVEYVFGKDFLKNSLVVNFTRNEISLFGRAGNFEQSRSNRLYQKIFLNNRVIESSLISRKIMECYGSILPKDKFPSFVLNIQLPTSWSDINVHPQKKEVRFLQEKILLKVIEDCFIELFGNVISSVFLSYPIGEKKESFSSENVNINYDLKTEPQKNYILFDNTENENSLERDQGFIKDNQLSFFQKNYSLLKNMPPFLLVEDDQELFLVHAVNVRKYLFILNKEKGKVLFEKQLLFTPLILDFSFIETTALLKHLEHFHSLCFEIDYFGQTSFSINAIPSILFEEEVKDCLSKILAELIISEKTESFLKDFSIILYKSLKKAQFIKKDYSKISLLLDCFWSLGHPQIASDGTILCKQICLTDLAKWLNV